MQIELQYQKTNPLFNGPLKDYCVQAGDTIDFLFTATDPDKDLLTLNASSGVFGLASCKATFTKVDSVAGFASSRFRWITCHEAVRKQPYNVIFKSDDSKS